MKTILISLFLIVVTLVPKDTKEFTLTDSKGEITSFKKAGEFWIAKDKKGNVLYEISSDLNSK